MALPEPVPGLVIRYSYLWESEAKRGLEEGNKDRPCAVVLTTKQESTGKTRVMVAPITHSPPASGMGAVEVPPKIGQALGLDAARSWIVTSEVNTFTWPGPDLRAARDKDFAFGRLPHNITEQVRQGTVERSQSQLKTVERDELPLKDWNAKASAKPREIKPLPIRDRDDDRER